MGDELTMSARIIGIVDKCEELTSRGGGERLTPFHALSRMRYQMAAGFDLDILANFIQLLGSLTVEQAPRAPSFQVAG